MTTNRKRQGTKTIAISSLISAVLIAGSMVLPGYSAQDTITPVVAAGATADSSFADLIAQAQPSVVTVEVKKIVKPELSSFNGDPRTEEFFDRFFGRRGQTPMQPRQAQGVGSGFIIDETGFIVTNNHVIADADEVTVRLHDDREFTAEVVGYDDRTDLALLKIEADELAVSTLGDSDTARVGDWVVAIGNPFGLGGTATVGIVSARGRDIRSGPYDDYLQIDAPINQGNSGGPIFNTQGEVVGVNTAIFSPNGGSVGIGFAIPSNLVEDIVTEIRTNGSVDRGWLGVQLQDLDQDLADGLGLESQDGALISDVVADSPASSAGIKIGDVILGYNDKDVKGARDLSRLVGASDSGDEVELSIWRGDSLLHLDVTLGDIDTSVSVADAAQEFDDLGLGLVPLNDELRARLDLDAETTGVVIVDIAPDGEGAKHGFRRGDVLMQVDRKPIKNPKDLKKALAIAKKDGKTSVPVLVRRGDMQQFSTLPVA